MVKYFERKMGASVLVEVETNSEVPAGSGLGSSSTIVVALVKAYACFLNIYYTDFEIAEISIEIERNELGLSGGLQDQYAAAFGGINLLQFTKCKEHIVNRISVTENFLGHLESSLLLINSEKSRKSAQIIDQQKELANKVQTLVETYMTMQIVILAIYIIVTATSTGGVGSAPGPNDIDPLYLVIMMPPIVTILFLFMVHKLNKPKIKELDFKKILGFGIPGILVAGIIFYLDLFPGFNIYFLAGALMLSAAWPALKFKNKYKFALDAEKATSQIMRDVAEARKAGGLAAAQADDQSG